jgi:PAS domain S-box-containing protein
MGKRQLRFYILAYFGIAFMVLALWVMNRSSIVNSTNFSLILEQALSVTALLLLIILLIILLMHIVHLYDEWQKKEDQLVRQNVAIMEAKARDEAMLESIGDAVVVTDNETRITFVNKVFEAKLGWKFGDVKGKPVSEILPVQDENEDLVPYEKRAHIRSIFTGTKIEESMKYYYERKDKSTFPVSFTVTPIQVNGETTGAIEVFRDASHEKEIDEQKSAFISVASHQLRTPLTSMRWYLEMLMSDEAGALQKNQMEYISEVYTSCTRLSQLVNDLLNVSRIESGRIAIKPTPTDIAEVVHDSVDGVKNLLENSKITMEVAIPKKGFGMVPVDPGMLRQVLHNYLTNAIRYTKKDSKSRIHLRVQRRTIAKKTKKIPLKKGKYIVFSVKDEGIGIPLDQQDQLFQKFFRAENALNYVAEGNGLGLYLVHMIASSSGGAAWFTSHVKKGSTFYFAIPEKGMKQKKGDRSFS